MKKIKFIGMVLAVSLVLMGVAFAAGWTDSLLTTANVNTGNLAIEFDGVPCPWSPPLPASNDPGWAWDPEVSPPMHVGNTECYYSADKKQLTIVISNAYPGYTSEVTYGIKNTGSIPVKLGAPILAWGENTNGGILGVEASSMEGMILPAYGFGQISPNQTIKTTVKDGAAQNGTYSYTITLNAGQFNK